MIIGHLSSSLPYREVLKLQERLFDQRIQRRKEGLSLPPDVILLVEHRPVVTLGLHGKITNLNFTVDYLLQSGVDFAEIRRGGDITYHGPGQLTVYPVIDLQRYRLGVKEYVDFLEETVIKTIERFGIEGHRIEGKSGVWVKDKITGEERKICAIGVKCSRHVTMHGFALNVGGNLEGFSYINPCGLGMGVTSISIETGNDVTVEEVRFLIAKILKEMLERRATRLS